ncbi:MAG: tetratricopeptide repeat protein [Planctomycetota bacterium]
METVKPLQRDGVQEANQIFSEGRYEEAIQRLESSLKENPGSPAICAALCNMYIECRESEIPKEIILNGVDAEPGLCDKLIIFANSLFEENALKESNQILETLVWKNPDNYETWNNLGAVRFAMNDLVTSEKAFMQALALQPGYGESIANLAALYMETNRPKLAVQTALNCLDERCDMPPAMVVELASLISGVAPLESSQLLRSVGKRK